MKNAEVKQALVWAAIIASIYIALFVWTTDINAHQKWGDDHSTMLSMYAGQVFAERGFVDSQFTVRIPAGVGQDTETTYTHFPPLPYYVAGLLWSMGGTSLAAIKLTFFVFALASVLGVYAAVRELLGLPIAVCAAMAIVLHDIAYLQLPTTPVVLSDGFVWWALFFLIRALRASGRSRAWMLGIAWCLHWMNCWSSFEYIIGGQILFATVIFWEKRDLRTWLIWNIIFGLAPILMMVIHGATNAWALGGVQAALEDFGDAFLWRTMDVGKETDYFTEISGGPSNFPGWLLRQLLNLYGLLPFYAWLVREPLRVAHYTASVSPEYVIAMVPFVAVLVTPIVARFSRTNLSSDAQRLLKLVAVFCIADLSFLLIFQQLASIHIYRQVGRHWLSTYGILVGGACYLSWRGTFRVQNSSMVRFVMSFLLVLVASIPIVNAATLIAFGPIHKDRNYDTEFETLKVIADSVPREGAVLTDDAQIWQCAFVHQPAESFGIAQIDLHTGDHDFLLSEIRDGYRDGTPRSLWIAPKQMTRLIAEDHRIATAYVRELSTESRVLFTPTGAWEEAQFADIAPTRTALSDASQEMEGLTPYSATYGATAEVIAPPDGTGANVESEWCIRIQSAEGAKSGIQSRPAGTFTLEPGTTYEITWRVFCDESVTEFKAGLAGTSAIYWSTAPGSSNQLFSNTAGQWTTFRGFIESTDAPQEVFVFLHQNEERTLNWYVDSLQIVAIPQI